MSFWHQLDEISEAEAKYRLMAVCPAAIGIDRLVEACGNARAGFVAWDAMPPVGVLWSGHRLSFLEAIYTALAFCGTDTRDEWCVLGAVPLIYMRSMPGFEQVDPVVCEPFVYIGKLKTILMYTDSAKRRPPGDGCEFVCGVGSRAARGQIQHAPITVTV